MASVMVSAICNKCQHKYVEMWLDRCPKGFPDYKSATCGQCGAKGCLSQDWAEQKVNSIIPPVEDGNINRMEYSYVNENGKTINRKMDPKMVEKHFKRGGK